MAATIDEQLRAQILDRPDVILDDRDLMRALVSANEKSRGENIVDLRGIAMSRLESRLTRLEDTHRSVIAAAYENLAGTNQVHRAVLKLLDPDTFAAFLDSLRTDVAEILRVDFTRVIFESKALAADVRAEPIGDVLSMVRTGFVETALTGGRDAPSRAIVLRQIQGGDPIIYGDAAEDVRSEALIKLDLGAGRLPGLLVLGAEDPHLFTPQQGSDLLAFFGGVFERQMRRWLN